MLVACPNATQAKRTMPSSLRVPGGRNGHGVHARSSNGIYPVDPSIRTDSGQDSEISRVDHDQDVEWIFFMTGFRTKGESQDSSISSHSTYGERWPCIPGSSYETEIAQSHRRILLSWTYSTRGDDCIHNSFRVK